MTVPQYSATNDGPDHLSRLPQKNSLLSKAEKYFDPPCFKQRDLASLFESFESDVNEVLPPDRIKILITPSQEEKRIET